ncbi:FAD-binding domain-containing protein [Aspergillus crustosus]
MVQISSVLSFGLVALASLGSAAPTSCPDDLCLRTRASLSPLDVGLELGPLLSTGSSVFGPDDTRWANATARYQEYAAPTFTVAVQVAEEADVPVVINDDNRNGLPFYAVNRGHTLPVSQERFKGLLIDVPLLTGIEIHASKGTATLQGGTCDQLVMDYLWEHGYEGTTGSCGCVGMLGPALGGGHGRLEGLYGMISDNLVSLNVVLANGSKIVVSDTSHEDLFWGKRGAGHNFGLVTSFEMKIYPIRAKSWYYRNYVFTQDALEDLFEALSALSGNGTQPVVMAAQYGIYTLDPTVSETEAIIRWTFAYAGSESEAQSHLTPFDKLNPLSVIDGNVPYPSVPDIQGTGIHNATCAKGFERITGPAGLQVYNVTTQRHIYELFNRNLAAHPEFNASGVVMEGYSVAGVRAVDGDSSAYPSGMIICLQSTISYPPNADLDPIAIQWAEDKQRLWNEGQPTRRPSAYVNYASGRESLQEMYGYEPWRLERLRRLKAEYDPEGRFSYYNPIV